MEEKIKVLYGNLSGIAVSYLSNVDRDNITAVQKMIPQIQEFVLWFMEENRFGISLELYEDLKENLLTILEDILNAIRERDRVLMHDAMAYGLMEYLGMLMSGEREEDANDDI